MPRYTWPLLWLLSLTSPLPNVAMSNSKTTVMPRRTHSQHWQHPLEKQLSIRGGDAGRFHLLPKEIMAKAACIFFIGQSTTAWLAPHRTCIKYGLTTSVLNVACNRKLATAYLASALIMYGMLFQKCTAQTAVGSAAVAWMGEQLRARLYHEAEEIGRPVSGEYWIALGATTTAWATLWQPQYATLAMKISSALLLANGMAFFASPSFMCKVWAIPVGITATPRNKQQYSQQVKEYNESVFLHRYMGVALVFNGILQAVLAWDGGIYEAIGYAYGYLFLINCWSFFKTSDFKRLARSSLSVSSTFDLKKRMAKLFFPLFNAAVSGTLLIRGSQRIPTP